MTNSLMQVTGFDRVALQDGIDQFISWYFRHCQEIRDAGEILIEGEDDCLCTILNQGLRCLKETAEIEKAAKRGDQI